ncbi:MAG: DUF2634 domain-containing protein [Lachnospiraceae bacterium]|nr:DUF2634 domain-containing protein [Lachnospiraceae bacterium]
MSVFIPIPIETVTEAPEKPSFTYRLDMENGRIVGKIDGIAAVNQAILKAILTPRFKCLIYDNQYGSEIEETIIAKNATRNYMETAIEGFIKDALLSDTRILSIYDFKMTWQNDKAFLFFKADTIFGETELQVSL